MRIKLMLNQWYCFQVNRMETIIINNYYGNIDYYLLQWNGLVP